MSFLTSSHSGEHLADWDYQTDDYRQKHPELDPKNNANSPFAPKGPGGSQMTPLPGQQAGFGGMSTWLLLGGAVLVGLLLFRRKK